MSFHPSSKLNASSSGIGNDLNAIRAYCQNLNAEIRLQTYRLEEQQQEIQDLKEKVEMLALHKATQLGQDKIIGFMVGAIVLSLLSLATSVFFTPAQSEAYNPQGQRPATVVNQRWG